jgi:hypothetical protein
MSWSLSFVDIDDREYAEMGSNANVTDTAAKAMPSGIVSGKLDNCSVLEDGRVVHLSMWDQAGESTFVEFPFDQTASLALTLPRLLTKALQMRTGRSDARYVYPVARWSLELAQAESFLILSLQTSDGFGVYFGVPFEMCKEIGSAMSKGGASATESGPIITTHVH